MGKHLVCLSSGLVLLVLSLFLAAGWHACASHRPSYGPVTFIIGDYFPEHHVEAIAAPDGTLYEAWHGVSPVQDDALRALLASGTPLVVSCIAADPHFSVEKLAALMKRIDSLADPNKNVTVYFHLPFRQ
jgi:hypothetical protein